MRHGVLFSTVLYMLENLYSKNIKRSVVEREIEGKKNEKDPK